MAKEYYESEAKTPLPKIFNLADKTNWHLFNAEVAATATKKDLSHFFEEPFIMPLQPIYVIPEVPAGADVTPAMLRATAWSDYNDNKKKWEAKMEKMDSNWAKCCHILRDHLDLAAKSKIAEAMRQADPHARFDAIRLALHNMYAPTVAYDARELWDALRKVTDVNQGGIEKMFDQFTKLREAISGIPGAEQPGPADMKYLLLGACKNLMFSEYMMASGEDVDLTYNQMKVQMLLRIHTYPALEAKPAHVNSAESNVKKPSKFTYSKDACWNCGKSGHHESKCYNRTCGKCKVIFEGVNDPARHTASFCNSEKKSGGSAGSGKESNSSTGKHSRSNEYDQKGDRKKTNSGFSPKQRGQVRAMVSEIFQDEEDDAER